MNKGHLNGWAYLALLIVSLTAALTPRQVFADSFGTSTIAQVSLPNGDCIDEETGPSICGASYTISSFPVFLNTNGNANAFAGPGVAKAAVGIAASASDLDPNGGASIVSGSAFADATFFDTETLLSSVPLSGNMLFSVSLDGSAGSIVNDGGSTEAGFLNQGSASGFALFPGFSFVGEQLLPNGTEFETLDLPFTTNFVDPSTGLFGASVPFGMDIRVQANCTAAGARDGSGTCSAIANWGDTLQVTGLSVVDLNGLPVTGVRLSSASGYDYNSFRATVPEPGSIVLLVSGLCFAGLARRRSPLRMARRLP